MNAPSPMDLAWVWGWDRVVGWDTGGGEKAWAAWGMEGWEAVAGVVKENSAIGNRAGSCMEPVTL